MLYLYYYYIISILLCAVSSHLIRHIFASLHLFWRISLTFWRIRYVFSSHLVVKSTHLHFRVKRVFNILSHLRHRTYHGGRAVYTTAGASPRPTPITYALAYISLLAQQGISRTTTLCISRMRQHTYHECVAFHITAAEPSISRREQAPALLSRNRKKQNDRNFLRSPVIF